MTVCYINKLFYPLGVTHLSDTKLCVNNCAPSVLIEQRDQLESLGGSITNAH